MNTERCSEPPTKYHAVVVHGKRQNEVFHVDARYSDLKMIGSGSYGVVCAAMDRKTNSRVAIKKVTDALADAVDAGRVLRELRLLRHIAGRENTLKIRDAYTYPPDMPEFEDVYIVTDLLETDMDRVLRSSQDLTSQHYRYFLYQLLRSVANMHKASVLHRDLKPSNLLCNANCDLVVCDFGLARGVSNTEKQPPNTARTGGRDAAPEDENDHLTEYVVTRWYRSPEILGESRYYGAAADIWSVGCIFGEMVDKRRKPIFRGSCPQNQLHLIAAALGCPTEDEIAFCTSATARKSMQKVCGSTKVNGRGPWDFKERFPDADPQAVDLLQKMLLFDPRKRITAEEALNHPYLHEVHLHWPKMKKIPKFDFSFEKLHHDCNRDRIIPNKDLRNLFLYEVNKYRPVQCHIPTPLYQKKKKVQAKSTSISSERPQILKLCPKSNQGDSGGVGPNANTATANILPVIGGKEPNTVAANKKAHVHPPRETNKKVARGRVVVAHKKGGHDNVTKFFRKRNPASVVPAIANTAQKDRLSQSLKPPETHKHKMLGKGGKSASASALLRKPPGAVKTKPRKSLIRRASGHVF